MNKNWLEYLAHVTNDPRMTVWHMALLLAIIQLAYAQGVDKTVRVSRSKLMKKSLIRTIPTFHKYFKNLQDFGYIKYTPSYHPGFKSIVEFIF
jgi:hypothetical protein